MCTLSFGLIPALLLIFGGFFFGLGFHLAGRLLSKV